MLNNKALDLIIEEVALEMDLPKEVILVAYKSYFDFIKHIFETIEFDNINDIDFIVGVNIPFIGKFYSDYRKVINSRKRKQIILERNESKKIKN